MSGNSGAKGLTEGENGLWIRASGVDEVLIGCLGVAVKAGFAWISLTVAVAAVFQSEHVCGHISEEFVDGGAIGHVRRIAMEREKCEFGLVVGNPPGVEFRAIGSSEPNILDRQSAWMPVAVEPTWIIREKDQAGFKYADKGQHQEVANKNVDQEHQGSAAEMLCWL